MWLEKSLLSLVVQAVDKLLFVLLFDYLVCDANALWKALMIDHFRDKSLQVVHISGALDHKGLLIDQISTCVVDIVPLHKSTFVEYDSGSMVSDRESVGII
jgi:hypothetical protein